MSTSTIRLDDGVREETTRIASEMGLTFNAVMNILARKFNDDWGTLWEGTSLYLPRYGTRSRTFRE